MEALITATIVGIPLAFFIWMVLDAGRSLRRRPYDHERDGL